MTSLGAIGSAATAAYTLNRVAARPPDSTPTPTVDSAQRAEALTRQLDATITDRLARIRRQISSQAGTANTGQAAPLRLDIRA